MNNCIKEEYDDNDLIDNEFDTLVNLIDHSTLIDKSESVRKNKELKQLNRDIVDLNEMIGMINKIIQEQGEHIVNIEKSVIESKSNIQTGLIELNITEDRKKIGNKIKYAGIGILCFVVSVPLGIYVGTPIAICTSLTGTMFSGLAMLKK